MAMTFLRRLSSWLRRRNLESDFQQEIRQHLELKIQANIARGMSPAEASRQAHLEFGSPTRAQEHTRQNWGFPFLETLLQDIRYAARQLRKNPGFTSIAVITLALGVGANSAMFSFVDAFLLSSLPVKNPEELVKLQNYDDYGAFDQKNYEQLRDQNHTLTGMIAQDEGNIAMVMDGTVNVVPVDFLSANSFALLGVPAYRGRVFTADD